MLDLGLDEGFETAFLGRFFNAVDDGVAPLLKHKAGVIALSDAGAHLIYFCDAGFGLHFLGHWVRERGDFDIVEGVRRLTSHQAGLYGIPDRGRIAVGAHADMLLFDPAAVGISPARRATDLPGGGRRTIRDPLGVHGVFVNGTRVFDGREYATLAKGPGQILTASCQPAAPLSPPPRSRFFRRARANFSRNAPYFVIPGQPAGLNPEPMTTAFALFWHRPTWVPGSSRSLSSGRPKAGPGGSAPE